MPLLLSLLAADPTAAMIKVATERAAAACDDAACAGQATRSRYRLDPEAVDEVDGKTRAVRTTGSQCAITGPTLCTRKPRTVFTTSY